MPYIRQKKILNQGDWIMSKKLIITAAVCGAGTTKAQNPHVPITPDEIAADVVACAKAGAAIAPHTRTR